MKSKKNLDENEILADYAKNLLMFNDSKVAIFNVLRKFLIINNFRNLIEYSRANYYLNNDIQDIFDILYENGSIDFGFDLNYTDDSNIEITLNNDYYDHFEFQYEKFILIKKEELFGNAR